MTEPGRQGEPPPEPLAPDAEQRTSMAAERTWLAWWRTALAATVGALAVGRFGPEVLGVTSWPYIALGVGYACVAIGLLLAGALRQHKLERALETGTTAPLSAWLVAMFTAGGVLLALTTVVLVVAQT